MKSLHTLAVLVVLAACSSPQKTTLNSTASHQASAAPADSIIYYRTSYDVQQKDYLPMMLGQWVVQTMQRQTKLPEETLNISLQLNEDRTFVAATPCGELKGMYSVKGTSIKFKSSSFQHISCTNAEQLDAMAHLLANNVSLYYVNGNMLFLRDNSGNNIFRVTR
jgi:heat shock protein HslJ